ncbi:MAG: hypothetical protein HeimC3_28270 [Candidatus Heimdallarchaeota archaeon LC_3]|nr:MAG: hypothetical protein HeimC3_28270 [Candidatus Heimdallarchaeota archaeon LC_3]
MRIGLLYAKKWYPQSDWVVTMDGDGQHSPKDILKLVKSVEQKRLLILIGNRVINENPMNIQPHRRHLANVATTKFVNKIFKLNISDLQSGFRIYHQKITPYLIKGTKSTKFQFETEILLEAWAMNITIGEESIIKIYYPSLPSRINGVEDTLKWVWLVFLRIVFFPKKFSQRRNNKNVIWEIWKEISN